MGNSFIKHSEAYAQIMVRFPIDDAEVKKELERIAKQESKKRGHYVSVNDLCKSALRAFVKSHQRDNAEPVAPFKLHTHA